MDKVASVLLFINMWAIRILTIFSLWVMAEYGIKEKGVYAVIGPMLIKIWRNP